MIPLWLIPLFPLVGTLILGAVSLVSSESEKGPFEGLTGAVAVFFPFLAFAATVAVSVGMPESGIRDSLGSWIDLPFFEANFGFLFDGLSRVMLLFITGIGTMIALYSMGYMHGDRGYARFFSYINFFLFSMIMLVLSDSLLLTFLGWEGVGLCSYLLIGFWDTSVKNCKAANKAFLVNRVGDVGFILGMILLVFAGGSSMLSYDGLNQWLHTSPFVQPMIPLLSIAGLLFFIGCTAKSAQIPLLTWLPDAMAGPTPVSALIHAATMVTSGVYLLARLSNLFVLLPTVMLLIAFIGLFTAFWAAVAGLFQNDIKKVLAYSTISQLGYMFMAAGVAAFDASIFHVFTHAFFKGSLFLAAGAIIHSLGGEQDMRKMGGLLHKTPVTALVMIFGFLAIIGFPGFAGFWSKDLILEHLYASSPVLGPILYVGGLLTAILTAVYMGRLIIMTFFGSYRGSAEEYAKIHEAPAIMLFPMLVLTLGSALAGFFWAGNNTLFRDVLAPVVGAAQTAFYSGRAVPAEVSPWVFAGLGTLAVILGVTIAWVAFRGPIPEATDDSAPKGRKGEWTFAFDTIHYWCGIFWVNLAAWIVENVINRFVMFLQWFVGSVAEIVGDGVRFFQVRKVQLQLGLSLFGMVVLICLVFFYGGIL